MKKHLLLLMVVLTLFGNSVIAQVNGEILSDTGNIQVIKVWGNHYERGFAYGYLSGSRIYSMFHNYIMPNYGAMLPMARAIVGNPLLFSFDSIYMVEAQAMLDGMASAGIDTIGYTYLDIFVANCMTDLLGFYPGSLPTQGCSSLMNWGDATLGTDLNGKSVLAHHLDTDPIDTNITNNQVIVIHIPSEADEQPWALTGTAGQMNAAQGLNMNGVSAFINTVDGFSAQYYMSYEPLTFALRKGLEKNDFNNDGRHNVNDIRDALSANTNGYASGTVVSAIASSSENEDSLIAMVCEVTPIEPYLTFRYSNYNDNLDGDNLYAANDFIKRNDTLQYCNRYNNVSNTINNSYSGQGIGSVENWDIMKTQSTQSTNLQFIQVIPEDCVLKMAVRHGSNPAYNYDPQVFNFCELFTYDVDELAMMQDTKTKLYPNPATDQLTIEFDYTKGSATVEVFSVLGQKVLETEIGQNSNITISHLEAGMYVVKLTQGGITETHRLIKR